MPLSQSQILNSRYRIVKLLGQGGFGAVYRAWDISLQQPVALKENLATDLDARHQFEREAIILARLRHPNLARVTDHFLVLGQGQYLVMDYVEGEDLQEILDTTGFPIAEKDAVKWVSQICDALTFIHGQVPPIIHRDIKPANIKITPNGDAILVDFGIAKVYDPTMLTTAGARAVTLGYSPPEQYGRGKTDPLSDIYSLGATMYTMLTRKIPPDSVDVLAGTEPKPRDVRDLYPIVSLTTSGAIAKAMEVDRVERFSNAKAFKMALSYYDKRVGVPQQRAAGYVMPATPSVYGQPASYSDARAQPMPYRVTPAVPPYAGFPARPTAIKLPAGVKAIAWYTIITGGLWIFGIYTFILTALGIAGGILLLKANKLGWWFTIIYQGIMVLLSLAAIAFSLLMISMEPSESDLVLGGLCISSATLGLAIASGIGFFYLLKKNIKSLFK